MIGEFTAEERAALERQLNDYLGERIPRALQDESVVELSVNHDGVLWISYIDGAVEATGEHWESWRVEAFLGVIATLQGTVVRRNKPVLESWIPGYGARIEGVVPPAVLSPIFSIRRPPSRVFTLEDYRRADRMNGRVHAALTDAVRDRLNILVVGGTGSGKTTLVNALLAEIQRQTPDIRVGILEDTRELVSMSPAWFQLQTVAGEPGSPDVDLDYLLRVSLRLFPKRIVVGELRGAEITGFMHAANTGHPGGLSTVHSDSAELGLLRLEQLSAHATGRPVARAEVAQAVQMVVFVEKSARGPRVAGALRVEGIHKDGYVLKEIAA